MLAFIYGDTSWQVKLAVDEQTKHWLTKHPTGTVEPFSLAGLKYVSLFAEPRLLVLSNFLNFVEVEELLVEFKKNISTNKVDIVVAAVGERMELVKKHKTLFAWLEKNAQSVQMMALPKGERLGGWLEARVRAAGLTLSPAARQALILMGSDSMLNLGIELDKLIAHAHGVNAVEIDETAVHELIKQEQVVNNFSLVDAVATGDQRKAIGLWQNYLDQGEDPYALFGLLVYQFRNLLRVKALMVAAVPLANMTSQLKLHPYVIKKSYSQAKLFELPRLKTIYQELLALELGYKDGRIDLIPALSKLLLTVGLS